MIRSMTLFLLTLLFHSNVTAQYGGGNGTGGAPFRISLPEHLVELSNSPDDWSSKYFVLTNDIDMTGQTITPIGHGNAPFTGNFLGANYVIANLGINSPGLNEGTGFFGSFNGIVTNLGLVNIAIDAPGNNRTGAFIGSMAGGEARYCFSEGGNINVGGGGWTGGLVGVMWDGGFSTVEDCYSTTHITANWGSGGIVGAIRGQHSINRVAFYGLISGNPAIVSVQDDNPTGGKNGIPPTNSIYATSSGATDQHATDLNADQLLFEDNYPTLDFESIWQIDADLGYAILRNISNEPALTFFERIGQQKEESSDLVEWKNFGPGMSGYNEEFWCHPTDTNVMFMGPDMHNSFGTWDNGRSWHSLKDFDGDGLDLERVNDLKFSLIDPDYGVAIERRGKVFETRDRGRTWELVHLIPHAATSPWYNAHSKLAIHPTNDSIWTYRGK